MKKILIGSSAIKHWFSDFNREPKDWDYIVTEIPNWTPRLDKRVEYHFNPLFDDYKSKVMFPNELLTLKCSHLFWDIQWEKHMWDIQFLLKKGCVIDIELFYKLYEHWNIVHSKNRRSDLKMTGAKFFDNAITFPIEHDLLHTFFVNPPTYTKILKIEEEVDVDEESFNNLSFEEKCSLVTEEIIVMSMERWSQLDIRIAYSRMLKKFIISHAPLWEALFIIKNFIELNKCPKQYLEIVKKIKKEYGI